MRSGSASSEARYIKTNTNVKTQHGFAFSFIAQLLSAYSVLSSCTSDLKLVVQPALAILCLVSAHIFVTSGLESCDQLEESHMF